MKDRSPEPSVGGLGDLLFLTDPKVYWNNGGSPVTFSPCPGLGLYHAAYADMNGDLWTDIVGADGYRGILFLNSANCAPGIITFQESRTALPGKNHPTWHPPTYGVALGDLDGDGDGDGDVDIVFGQGDGGHEIPNLIFLNNLIPQ
jgi:hypothetical protein